MSPLPEVASPGEDDAEDGRPAAQPALMLDAALESIPYGFCVWDASFCLLMWNRHYLEMYGFRPDRIYPGMPLEEVVVMSSELGNHPGVAAGEFLAAYKAELLGNRSGARAKSLEALSVGRVVETAHVYAPGLGWVVTHEDVTEEIELAEIAQQRKRELERQNLRLHAAVNNIGHGLAMFDAQGRLVISNRPYQKIYGLPDELTALGTPLEAIGRYLFGHGMTARADIDSKVEIGFDEYIANTKERVARRIEGRAVLEVDGRLVVVQHHPMQDGGWVSTHEDITAQRATEARLSYLARHDTLTDLPNRMSFVEKLTAEEESLGRGAVNAVLSININRFKVINDTLGNGVGDAVLRQVAMRLKRLSRPTDYVARLGGDVFAMLVREVDGPMDAAEVAERMIGALRMPLVVCGQTFNLDISIGIAVSPGDGRTAEALMAHAELALDRARAEGHSVFHLFEPQMDAVLQRRRHLETGLRNALVRGELHLAFQPVVDVRRQRVTALEALLRWTHPDEGIIEPSEFVPIAEQTGLIVPIGEWVLNEACRIAADWPDDVRVAVNLSAVQFKVKALAGIVADALSRSGLPPSRLDLEITESILLADNAQTLSTLHQLRRMGVRISMDDFGTGYSSLSYLRSFPFDTIKIDRSFMRGAETPDGLAIIRAVIGLGRALGMTIIAEGVETESELDVLRREGCDEAQGYYFSRPVGVEAATTFLDRCPPVDRRRIA